MSIRKTCPKCNSQNTAEFVYGMVTADSFTDDDHVVFAGCGVGDNDPDFLCETCKHQWRLDGAKPDKVEINEDDDDALRVNLED